MPDITTLQGQREAKPKIELLIPVFVAGEQQETALGFIAWLRANRMAPGWSGVHNAWDAKCKGKTICKISLQSPSDHTGRFDNASWEIKLYCTHKWMYEESIISEGLQQIIWDRLKTTCDNCLGGTKSCVGGNDMTVLGMKFTGVCPHSLFTQIYDPDEATINGVQRMIELEQQARKGSNNV